MDKDLLSQLNEPQREAAGCTEGPVMIIAGAGSGKTRTLTYRIAHLIEIGVDTFSILALTFTNKAAAEMKERIIKLVGREAKDIWMGTFHSVFARILRAEAERLGYIRTFTIYDNDDSKSAIKQIVKNLNLDPKEYSPGAVLSRISMAKSNLISPEDYAENPEIQQTDKDSHKPMMSEIYKLYNQRLRNSMAMDFDDLLFNMNILLRDFPDVLLKYQQRFRYIMVDEYQDTNYSQYLIIKKLAARYQNICVVGDDAQSIYAFRGANIQNIFNFRRDYPNLNLFKLEQNYRSTQVIVNAANSVIAKNKEQIEKNIWTDNAVGSKIRLIRAADERDEGRQVAESILSAHLADELEYKDFAILYRTNVQSRAIEEALRRANIPYRIYQGLSFYGRKEIKDILAYLRLVVNNYDDESLLRIINYPARGIGQTTLDRIRLAAADNDVAIWTVLENIDNFGLGINSGVQQRISQFVILIKRFSSILSTTNAYDLAKQIVYASGVITFLRNDEDPDNPNRIENIEELLNGVKEFCENEDQFVEGEEVNSEIVNSELTNDDGSPDGGSLNSQFTIHNSPALKTLDQFLQQVLLLTSEDKGEDKDADKVAMMTIHAAKGLEFPYVFVVGMEENLFPSFMSLSSRQDLEEERRLFYVAVTRAERNLTLSYAITRYQYGNSSCQELSRFVEDIDSRYLDMPQASRNFPKVGDLPRAFQHVPGAKGLAETQRSFKKKEEAAKPAARHLQPKSTLTKGPTVPNSPAAINAIQVGMEVMHAKFGRGKVMNVEGSGNDRKAVVFFEGIGQKTLILAFAKLTIVE
ncbi:MAG: UvrD-helicase domain-containing protein [Bacteroidales bacterium]|nr:UvrD-helicase domain-containing protein [Bacteroidales bacterium]